MPDCVYFPTCSIMCFVFHDWAFDDVMIFEYLKKVKFDYLKIEKSFRSEIKNIFLVSQVLSFKHTTTKMYRTQCSSFACHLGTLIVLLEPNQCFFQAT